jgi:hypothetical protein
MPRTLILDFPSYPRVTHPLLPAVIRRREGSNGGSLAKFHWCGNIRQCLIPVVKEVGNS